MNMPTEPKKRRGNMPQASERPPAATPPHSLIQTAGIPTLYANLASLSMSNNDVRIYLMEVSPKEVNVVPSATGPRATEATVQPKLCVVVTPEFAKALRDSLTSTITNYEQSFGQLRTAPAFDALLKTLRKQ
jgi:hypothetical protein